MKLTPTLFLLTCFILYSCSSEMEKTTSTLSDLMIQEIISDSLFTPKNISSETFKIPKGNATIVCQDGTKLKIYEHSFRSKSTGLPIDSDDIEITVKHANKKSEFVLGNLVTLSNGKILESGGMIQIEVSSNGELLELRDGKEIGVSIPTNEFRSDMSIYQGVETNGVLNWTNPITTLNETIDTLQKEFLAIEYVYSKPENELTVEEWEAMEQAVRKKGVQVGDIIDLDKFDFVAKVTKIGRSSLSLEDANNSAFLQDLTNRVGVNSFNVDENTEYLFSMNKLGWVNIDRLYKDSLAEEVELELIVDNADEFPFVYISMIFNDRNIYLPGYQMKSKSYSFARSNIEPTILPLGEAVTIFATAYKKGIPYFTISELNIEKQQSLKVSLSETTLEDIQLIVEKKLN